MNEYRASVCLSQVNFRARVLRNLDLTECGIGDETASSYRSSSVVVFSSILLRFFLDLCVFPLFIFSHATVDSSLFLVDAGNSFLFSLHFQLEYYFVSRWTTSV